MFLSKRVRYRFAVTGPRPRFSLAGAVGALPTRRRTDRSVPGRCGCVPRGRVGPPRAFGPLLHGQPLVRHALLVPWSGWQPRRHRRGFVRAFARACPFPCGWARHAAFHVRAFGHLRCPGPVLGLPATRRPGGCTLDDDKHEGRLLSAIPRGSVSLVLARVEPRVLPRACGGLDRSTSEVGPSTRPSRRGCIDKMSHGICCFLRWVFPTGSVDRYILMCEASGGWGRRGSRNP